MHKEANVHKRADSLGGVSDRIREGQALPPHLYRNEQTRRITESRNVTFIETLPKALPPAGQEKFLETNEETLQEKVYHWGILGNLLLLSSPDEDQNATKASLAPPTSSDKKECTASTGSALRSPAPNSEGATS